MRKDGKEYIVFFERGFPGEILNKIRVKCDYYVIKSDFVRFYKQNGDLVMCINADKVIYFQPVTEGETNE